jgi:choline dehydrogenase
MATPGSVEKFDYVIVGAGTTGSVPTLRLAAANHSVCVLEGGARDLDPLIHVLAGYITNIYIRTLTWSFASEPGPGVNGRSFPLPRGRVLVGSSSIKGLNHVRGQVTVYDA